MPSTHDCPHEWNAAAYRTYNPGVKSSIDTAAPRRAVVITDGAMGNERQALALARALDVQPTIFRIRLRAPWRWTAPKFTVGARLALSGAARAALSPPWPALAIGCGRAAALVTRALRGWSRGACYTVQILDPRIDPAHYDLVLAPRHDGLSAGNLIATLGALNPIDEDWLAQAAEKFPLLQTLPRPRTALLVGGPRRNLALDEAWLTDLIRTLETWQARDGGSLLIAASRRTPPAWRERLRGGVGHGCTLYWGSEADGENPYSGMLAAADRIVVTPDSVNMLSEAAATGAPVFTRANLPMPAKLAAFHAELAAHGWLHDIDADQTMLRPAPPLREIALIASKVRQRIEATRPDIGAALESGA